MPKVCQQRNTLPSHWSAVQFEFRTANWAPGVPERTETIAGARRPDGCRSRPSLGGRSRSRASWRKRIGGRAFHVLRHHGRVCRQIFDDVFFFLTGQEPRVRVEVFSRLRPNSRIDCRQFLSLKDGGRIPGAGPPWPHRNRSSRTVPPATSAVAVNEALLTPTLPSPARGEG